MADPLTAALQRLNEDLAAVEQIQDEQRRAQDRAAAEQRWLTAAQNHIEGSA